MARRKLPQAKGVARIDDPGRHGVGWYARVTFRGKTVSKYFADASHGGTEAAFALAVAWRNTTERKVGKPRTDRVLPGRSQTRGSGVKGVYRSRDSYVVAWTPEPGVLRREFISINEFGAEEAFRRAVELRRKRERKMFGGAISREDDLLRRKRRAAAASKLRKAVRTVKGAAKKAAKTTRRVAAKKRTRGR